MAAQRADRLVRPNDESKGDGQRGEQLNRRRLRARICVGT